MRLQNQKNQPVTLQEFNAVAGKIRPLSFGGPPAQISLIQNELVDKRGWVFQADFLQALSFYMLLPDPEALQLDTYLGQRLFGVHGGLISGTLFVLPSALIIFVLAFVYVHFG